MSKSKMAAVAEEKCGGGVGREPLMDLLDTVQRLIDQISQSTAESGTVDDQDFNMDAFWTSITACMQAVSDAATKLCLAFSPQPLESAEEAAPLLRGVAHASAALVSTYAALPACAGTTLRAYVSDSALGILLAVQALLQALPQPANLGSKKHLQATGHTWEFADKFLKLPKNNGEAVMRRALETLGVVADALQEIEEAMADRGEGGGGSEDEEDIYGGVDDPLADPECPSDAWSDADRLVAGACVGLIKTAKACSKQLSTTTLLNTQPMLSLDERVLLLDEPAGCSGAAAGVRALDTTAQRLADLSPAVDELVSSLYPPLHLTAVQNNCLRLAASIKSTLGAARAVLLGLDAEGDVVLTPDPCEGQLAPSGAGGNGPANTKWIDFLCTAVEHNANKVSALISSMQAVG